MPGLNTIELDVKDEDGEVGFVPRPSPLARRTGAAAPYYNARTGRASSHTPRAST